MPHKRRRGGRYEILPGRGSRVKWEKIGDGAELDDEDDEFGEEDSGERESSDDEDEGVNGKSRGEVPYEDRWEVDTEALAKNKVCPAFEA